MDLWNFFEPFDFVQPCCRRNMDTDSILITQTQSLVTQTQVSFSRFFSRCLFNFILPYFSISPGDKDMGPPYRLRIRLRGSEISPIKAAKKVSAQTKKTP